MKKLLFLLSLALFSQLSAKSAQSCYIDMGILYGAQVIETCVDWSKTPYELDRVRVDRLLDTLLEGLRERGVDEVILSFAQVCDIDALLEERGGCPRDTITIIFQQNWLITGTGKDFLHYFVERAHEAEIRVLLAFGGALATSEDMKFTAKGDEAACRLATFVEHLDLDGVDFDVEGGGLELLRTNPTSEVTLFFKTLQQALQKQRREAILTVAGSIHEGPQGILKPLFDKKNFYFNRVNLMLYSNSEYYLDASNVTWGIDEWCKEVNSTALLHIGFYDSIAYERPETSAGKRYPFVEGMTRGQAARAIYETVLKESNLSEKQMGVPFWWTDNPRMLPTNQTLLDFDQA